jgi:hypothetical protein
LDAGISPAEAPKERLNAVKTRLFGWMIAAGMTLLTPLALQAQGIGLQVADLAEKHESGQLEVTPGATFGEHLSFYGVREAYTFSEELRAFIDVGAVNVDDSDFDFAAQAGALATLPSDTDLCDLGVRAAAYFLNTDREDIFGGNLMLVSSGETVLDSLYVYGGLGVDLSNRKSGEASKSRTELNPALSAGVLFNFTDSIAAYVEVSHVDSAFIGAGIRFR